MEKRFSLVIFGIEQTRLRGFCGAAGAVCLGLFPADSVAVESGLRGLTRILPKIGKAARSAKASASGKGVHQRLPFGAGLGWREAQPQQKRPPEHFGRFDRVGCLISRVLTTTGR
jgi:hypothetical protein